MFITFNYQLLASPFLRGYNIGNGIMGQQMEVRIMFNEESRILEVLQEFRRDFSDMREDINIMKDDIRMLKADVAELKTDVAGLKTDVDKLKQDVSVLKVEVTGLKQDVKDLQNRMIVVEGRTNQLQLMMNEMRDDLAEVKHEVFSLRTTIENVTNRNIRVIAEGHLDLEDKFDRSVKAGAETEVIKVRVNMIENEVRSLKDQNDSVTLI